MAKNVDRNERFMKLLQLGLKIDLEDVDLMRALTWTLLTTKEGKQYLATFQKGRTILLHRVIAARMLGRELARREWVDHKEPDTLDCRRSNLRVGTPAHNNQNTSGHRTSQLGLHGVYFTNGKFAARAAGRHIGVFTDPLQAYLASMAYRVKHFPGYNPPREMPIDKIQKAKQLQQQWADNRTTKRAKSI